MDYKEGQMMDVPCAMLITHTPALLGKQAILHGEQRHPNCLKS